MAMNTEMVLTPLSLKRQIAGVVVGERGGRKPNTRTGRAGTQAATGWGGAALSRVLNL